MNNILALLLCLLTASAFAQQGTVIDEVIARVGSEYILLSDLEEQYALAQSQSNTPIPPEARCAMLDQTLVGKLLYNQSKLDSIEVSDSEVEQQLNARIDRILSYMGGDINQFEDYYGQSITATKEQFREDLREQLAVDRMRASVVREVKVTPAEVKSFFAGIPRDSLPYFNSEVEVGELVVRPTANDSTKQAIVAQLESLREQIINGEITFEEAARKFSADGSARGGGDLGWTKRGKFVAEFEAAAYNLDPDEISGVVETEFGYHLIKLVGRRGNSIRVSHILMQPEITEADLEKSRQFLDSIANLIRVDSFDFSYAVKRFGYDKVQSYNNDGRMSNPASGNTFFEIGDLDPDIYFAIDELELDSLSDVLEFRGPSGDPLLRIVQLQSRTSPHRATLSQDYAKIQDATRNAKQQEYLSDWIQRKVGSTFINVDERYHSCPQIQVWLEDSRKITVGNREGKIVTGR
ncbi:peptidyl-prolyl cis-trans isomerase SurA [Lewinella marina]|uniref:Peptidylprolyl isomerase n=1 Tax=Neolewinella marina TaxID=438751 RepID=A0A2G0CH93_9BACT|nr:peptidylprolyl isomerase [Neolewinella marina]NJB86168.1 peptidyl-prolyl cis-trans isomerase SurA [Neolewinella marina]PHK99355.1 peptidylprolyl isomerase [Neolewinella marina]